MTRIFMLTSQSEVQMMSFIIKSNDKLLVVDGGNSCDADYLCDHIRQLGGVVDGWFITHAHSDHIDAIYETLCRHSDEIDIKTFYYNFPSEAFLEKADVEQARRAKRLVDKITEKSIAFHKVHAGEVLNFGEMTVRVLREPDESITTGDPINNSSVVYRVETEGKSIIFLGDLAVDGGKQLLELVPHELIKSDYVQMAHHGQNGVEKEVYEAIKPDYCFWCTPAWLWENDAGRGYDTHIWKTVVTRGWMSEIGVKGHYVSKDGTIEVQITEEK